MTSGILISRLRWRILFHKRIPGIANGRTEAEKTAQENKDEQ